MTTPPDEPIGWHSRGYLPHFDAGELPQSITLRLTDALPVEKLRAWEEEIKSFPPHVIGIERYRRIEHYLDIGHGHSALKDPTIAQLIENALLHFDGLRYRMHAWVIMPNHVHCLVTPCSGYAVSGIVQAWKSFTTHKTNKLLVRTGKF